MRTPGRLFSDCQPSSMHSLPSTVHWLHVHARDPTKRRSIIEGRKLRPNSLGKGLPAVLTLSNDCNFLLPQWQTPSSVLPAELHSRRSNTPPVFLCELRWTMLLSSCVLYSFKSAQIKFCYILDILNVICFFIPWRNERLISLLLSCCEVSGATVHSRFRFTIASHGVVIWSRY